MTLIEHLVAQHAEIDCSFRVAVARADRFDVERYEAGRRALLRHIAIEEKILLPFARERRGGVPLERATRLRKEHGAIASLLVPTPDAALVAELLGLLAAHDALEEGPTGVYAEIEALAGAEEPALLERVRALPPPPPARHFDGPGTHRTAAAALRAHE